MSMKPGATVRPFASMVCAAVPLTSPTAAILPLAIAIDPLRGAPPVPSTICALVIRTSYDGAVLGGVSSRQLPRSPRRHEQATEARRHGGISSAREKISVSPCLRGPYVIISSP